MGHSSVPVGLFSEKSTPYSFLQNARPPGSLRSPSELRTVLSFLCAFLQNARPPGSLRSPSVSAPKPSFRRFRYSAWLIQLRQRTALSPLKRSCSRFASLTLRTAHRPPVSLCFSGRLIFRLRAESAFQAAPVFRSAYSASRNARASAAFAASELRTALPFLLH